MAEDRAPREHEEREAEMRDDDRWVPQGNLPTPQPQDGWSFRWIRTSTLNVNDPGNMSKRLREGWIPVKASEHRELQIMSDVDARIPDSVQMGGLILCKMPTEKIEQRKRHYAQVASQQMETVDNNYLSDSDPRMPKGKYEDDTRTTFGSGRG